MRSLRIVRTSSTPAPPVPAPRQVCAMSEIVAHTPAFAYGQWHLLADHSRAVGDLGGEFAEPFGGSELVRLAGYLHDAGKATEEVQRRFHEIGATSDRSRQKLGVSHKLEGAQLMAALAGDQRAPLAVAGFLMSHGHHTGIPAKATAETVDNIKAAWRHPGLTAPLLERMRVLLERDLDAMASVAQLPSHVESAIERGDWAPLDLFTRMCHSALVDADFLDTAAHFGGHATPWRSTAYGMNRWLERFGVSYARRFADSEPSELNELRANVFDACVRVARQEMPAGIYRLPAPTGTGKTMASAAFALHHAARFGKKRVIVAVPFTTITTQNAQAYREAFGDLAPSVLEHHSNIIDDELAESTWRRLSAPGWDAEFIVTTTVQLFESLFSNRPAQTRKLHRVANSVIVLDEVQALPIDLLGLILGMLRELVEHYGVTVLLASATQPTFWSLPVWQGLPVHDILPVDALPDVTQRVSYAVRPDPQPWEVIAREVATEHQVLMIENRRADADALYSLVAVQRGRDDTFLLSKSMTADHRDRVLTEVRRRLHADESVAVVSTQLIEAGVDVDFPVVYRAIAPAEAVVQAAGRCNREGRLGVRGGRVVVYVPADGGTPPGVYATQTGIARDFFVDEGNRMAFDSPTDLAAYFDEVYRSTDLERRDRETTLGGYRSALDFPSLAGDFRMIKEQSVDVVVEDHPDEVVRREIAAALQGIRAAPLQPLSRATRRLLQRHSATISRKDVGLAEELGQTGVRVWCGSYDPQRGAVSDQALTW